MTESERAMFGLAKTLLMAAIILFPQLATSQQDTVQPERQPLPQEIVQEFQGRLYAIRAQQAVVADLEERRLAAGGVRATVFSKRMGDIWALMFEDIISLANDVAEQRDAGFDVSSLSDELVRDLPELPEQAIATMDRISQGVVLPEEDTDPAELVVLDQKLLVAVKRFDRVLNSLYRYVGVAESMGIDSTAVREILVERLTDGAANRSAYLAVAIEDVGILRAAAANLPNEPSLTAQALAAEARVRNASASLQESVRHMDLLELDARQYRQQILTATGQLTADVLDVGVVRGLIADWSNWVYDRTRADGPGLVLQALLFIFIIWVSLRLRAVVKGLASKAVLAYDVKMSHLLKRMIVSIVGNLVFLFGFLIALSQVGVSLGPLLAGLGIAGFIIGFALQDTLAKFASGLMILLYRPFDVGDVVEAGGVSGKVDRMSLVNTTFKTFDNQVLVVPNDLIWKTVITNLTDQKTRRVDLTFQISYHDDIDQAKVILREVAEEYDKVLADPAPMVKVGNLGESSVGLILRPWVRTSDYWDTYWDLTEIVKKRFDEEGFTIPFPQRTVHNAPE